MAKNTSIAETRYNDQKRRARARSIEFTLSFDEWYDIWQKSGHWEERGRKKGQYVMSRVGDTGAYAIGNVFIQTHSQNMSDAQTGRKQTPEHIAKVSQAITNSWIKRKQQKELYHG